MKLLLVEDNAAMQTTLQRSFERRGVQVLSCSDGARALERWRSSLPDVVLLDLSLPGRNGLDLIPEILRVSPDTRILVVTMHAEWVMARTALGSGASGFVPKDSSREELEHAIAEVLAGRTYLSSRIGPDQTVSAPPSLRQAWLQLTPRHRQIVLGIAAGRSTEDIASALGLSPHTIHFHRRTIRRILAIESDDGLASTAMLIKLAGGTEAGGWGTGTKG